MILHADLDSFYASVEQRDHPALRGRPVLVGGGVVLAASYEAKAYGVCSAMGLAEARRLCPAAVVVPARFDAYLAASRAVFAIFEQTTPLVEGLSVDEAFLDVAGLARVSGTPHDIAMELRRRVRAEVGLAITVGVARTKFLAKVASGAAKPDGLLVVDPAGELGFLHPLPVRRVWGIGAVTAAKLADRGVFTVGDVAALPEPALVALLGVGAGRHVHALAHNRDQRPVTAGRRRRSIGAQRSLGFGRRHDPADVDAALVALCERVCRRLRDARRVCRTITLRLRFEDAARVTRSHTLLRATWQTDTVLASAWLLLAAAQPLVRERGLTLVGVALADLADAEALQLELPFAGREVGALDPVLDTIADRFGKRAVQRAVLLGRRELADVPLLPD